MTAPKLLDREPTPEMVEAGKSAFFASGTPSPERVWIGMWDAAPEALATTKMTVVTDPDTWFDERHERAERRWQRLMEED